MRYWKAGVKQREELAKLAALPERLAGEKRRREEMLF